MACKYKGRDIVYYCQSKRIAGHDVCEDCNIVKKSNFQFWEELPQEKRDEIIKNALHQQETLTKESN